MVKKTAASILFGALLAGCAAPYTPAPVATNFPTSTQDTLRAGAHWKAIAADLEQRLVGEMKKGPKRPFHIAERANPTPFQRVLTSQLITALVNDGYVVSHAPAGALKIDIDLQTLRFSPDRKQYRGELAALAAGVWVQRSIDLSEGATPAPEPAPSAVKYHHTRFADGATPKTEVIVTLSVSDQYRYYARTASAYYVAESDRDLYGFPVEEVKEIKEVNKMKTYQVRGDR